MCLWGQRELKVYLFQKQEGPDLQAPQIKLNNLWQYMKFSGFNDNNTISRINHKSLLNTTRLRELAGEHGALTLT